MTMARTMFRVAGAVLAMGTAMACGMDSLNPASADRSGSDADAGAKFGGNSPSTEGTADVNPTASGVVLVHAALFPAFRLCFEKQPQLRPLPDATIMPQANVVGVEVGSAVRIPPVAEVGKVYVIHERSIPAGDLKCGDLICDEGSRCLTKDNNWHEGGTIDGSLGQGHVDILVVSGCGNQNFLAAQKVDGGADNPQCGADWNPLSGSLKTHRLPIQATANGATDTTLPVQLFHLSPAIDAQRSGKEMEVTFTRLSTADAGAGGPGSPQVVATNPTLFDSATQVSLALDQTDETVYGTHGFRVSIAGGTVFEQSLADVQKLSSPRETPDSYFRAASNYALLMLGDPNQTNSTERQRTPHLLAVPVLDKEPDAGADASRDGATRADGGT